MVQSSSIVTGALPASFSWMLIDDGCDYYGHQSEKETGKAQATENYMLSSFSAALDVEIDSFSLIKIAAVSPKSSAMLTSAPCSKR